MSEQVVRERTDRTVEVDCLPRVEGEGALRVVVRGGRVERAELTIFEPPRFFEAFLRGRGFEEMPDITSRICGICPIAYQMSAVHAIENALGVTVSGPVRDLRRLIYCGEWIESHTLHVYMLHAPDFLGYPAAIEMARDHGDVVQRGLMLKKAGNDIMTLVGGREIHPINVRVGGFYRAPRRRELATLTERLEWARDAALETVRWVAAFDFPDRERDYEFVALRHPGEYPFNEGRIVSSRGLDLEPAAYDANFEEIHVDRSTALQSRIRQRGAYLCGPLARYNLNFERLSAAAQGAAREAGLGPTCTNPYRSIVVRAVEVLYACDEALRIIGTYEEPDRPAVEVAARAAIGHAATEAPRGLLWHRYRLNDDGSVAEARIVPPTSQNQASIEEDLKGFIAGFLDLPDDELRRRCEQIVRNYDPCISCATHFIRLEMDRGR
jgi:coenzyme F420-reducing hydrogenase alpha subunit